MLSVPAPVLEWFAHQAVEAFDTDAATVNTVANSLVGADLVGHSFHGVVRLPYHAGLIEERTVDPTATPTVESTGPIDQLVGGAAFGQPVGRQAVELLVDGATAHGVAVVGIRDSGHLGRIGEWAGRVADEGLLFAAWVNLQGGS